MTRLCTTALITQLYHRRVCRPSAPPTSAVRSRYPGSWSARRPRNPARPTRHGLPASTPPPQPPAGAAGTTRASAGSGEEGTIVMPQEDNKAELEKLCNEYKSSKFPDCPEVRPRELWERLAPGGASQEVLVVDVRRKEEQEVSMIPGAITQQEFEKNRDSCTGKQIYCYCTVGYRSGIYADKLRQEGMEASNIRGSILAWTQEGLPLVKKARNGEEVDTKQVHAYGKQWEPLHGEGYSTVVFRRPILKAVGQMLGGLW